MIPIKDDVPRRRLPFITWLLILVNVGIFIWQTQFSQMELMRFFYTYGIVPRIFLTSIPPEFTVLLSSMFLHGNLGHLVGNMWILGLFGDNVEDRLGRFSFLLFYLAAGVFSGLVHIIFNPSSMIPTIGASGAIAGVMGAYLFLFPLARVTAFFPIIFIPYFFRVPSFLYIGVWFLIQLYYGTLALGLGAVYGGIAWWAHIGGFVFGVIFYRFFRNNPKRT